MAPKFDVGPSSLPGRAAAFAGQVNEHGGSSMHIASGRFVEPGKDSGYMVGGHPYAGTTTRIPETVMGEGRLTAFGAATHMVRSAINSAMGGSPDPTAHVGGWMEDGRAVLDTSTRFGNRRAATKAAQARGEREVFDVKGFDTFKTPQKKR